MYDNAIFDFDGTLADTGRSITECVKRTLEHFGLPELNSQELISFVGPSLYYSFTKTAGLDEETATEAIAYYRKIYLGGGLFDCELYEGVPEALKKLKAAGVRLSVASAKPLNSLKQLLQHFKADGLFERLAAPEGAVKSNDKHALVASARICRSAVMVGDREFDIVAAKQNGIDSIGVTYGYSWEGELKSAKPTYTADSPYEVLNLILNNCGDKL